MSVPAEIRPRTRISAAPAMHRNVADRTAGNLSTVLEWSMLRLAFARPDLARVRFAHSPLTEAVLSAITLTRPELFAEYATWRAAVAPAVARLRLTTLPALLAGPHHHYPDFLTPIPVVPRPRLADELALVAATPLDRVAHETAEAWYARVPPPEVARFQTDPRGALDALVAELHRYFRVAVAPWWPRLRAAADAEISRRARDAADRGPGAAVAALHPTQTWDGTTLAYNRDKRTVVEFGLEGGDLVLMPSAFAGPRVFAMVGAPADRALWFPPRGHGTLWGAGAPGPLAALLGPTRAAVLGLLGAPHSTGEVATALGLSPATASHHLTTLRDAGLVAGVREGRRVRYLRTRLGDDLGTGAAV